MKAVALPLGEVGVGVAQIEREHFVGEADAHVPGVVARLRNTGSVEGAGTGAVEAIRRSEPLTAELARGGGIARLACARLDELGTADALFS